MKHTCLKCNRTIKWREALQYCPFCGSPYQAAAQAVPAATTRIAICSDSERTVQEKYWKEAQMAVTAFLKALKNGLPRFSQQREEEIIWDGEVPTKDRKLRLGPKKIAELRRCVLMKEFSSKLESILSQTRQMLNRKNALFELGKQYTEENHRVATERKAKLENGTWSVEEFEDEYAINVPVEAEFIEKACMKIADVLGNPPPKQLCPVVVYDPNSTQWLKEYENENADDDDCVQAFQLLPQYVALWKEIEDSSAAVLAALASNGLFSLSYMHGEPRKNFDPKQCAEDLQRLKNRDYDPLFGESPESFISTFFDGLVGLIHHLDHLPDVEEVMGIWPAWKQHELKLELDCVRLHALKELIGQWSVILRQELDQLYQSQSKDMLQVCNAIRAVQKDVGKEVQA